MDTETRLREQHSRLATAVATLEKTRQTDRSSDAKLKLIDLKKKKLAVKDQITRLESNDTTNEKSPRTGR